MSESDATPSGPVCLFDHGPMQPVGDGRWECILCSFVVITGPDEHADGSDSGHAA